MASGIWVFNGANARFSSGIFSQRSFAEDYIEKYKLTGVLTLYPVDEPVYEWAIRTGKFTPKKEHQHLTQFIQGFTTASMEHYHYEEGVCVS